MKATKTNTKTARRPALRRTNCFVIRERGARGATTHSLLVTCDGKMHLVPATVFAFA